MADDDDGDALMADFGPEPEEPEEAEVHTSHLPACRLATGSAWQQRVLQHVVLSS